MALEATHWSITRSNGNIRYIGDDHGGANPSYATVIEFHRWLGDLADEASSSGDDELDITDELPSARSTDNIIKLLGSYNIDDLSAEHLYDGSIIQGTGGTEEIWDGIVNFGNSDVQIQIIQNGAILSDDWWNYNEGGTHTGSADSLVLTDSAQTWTIDEWVGFSITNVTDTSVGIILSNTSNTITLDAFGLSGGTDNDFDASDAYLIGQPLNPDSLQGISHRFMIKTRTGGVDIDGRRLIGTSREFNKTYSEFPINGTSRGNNVFALANSGDLNNTTAPATVGTWSTITNINEGYTLLDIDNTGVDEEYYSHWNRDKGSYSINQFYERLKWISRAGSTETLYGLPSELFRGITHQIAYDTQDASEFFTELELLTFGNGATAQLLADSEAGVDAGTTGTMWVQILTGVAPTTSDSIAGATCNAVVTTVIDRSAQLSYPFVGASTGSALIGSYGLGLQVSDVIASDKLFDLGNNPITPPNNVIYTVSGLVIGEDRVLVAHWDGSSLDDEGNPAINSNQMALNVTLNTDNITLVQIGHVNGDVTAIPSDTPSSGFIRVVDDNGFTHSLSYSEWSSATDEFTIDSVDGQEDFLGVNATSGNDVWIAYLDLLAGSTSEAYTGVYDVDRNLVIIVRDGGASPIKQFISESKFVSSNSGISVIRTSDE